MQRHAFIKGNKKRVMKFFQSRKSFKNLRICPNSGFTNNKTMNYMGSIDEITYVSSEILDKNMWLTVLGNY